MKKAILFLCAILVSLKCYTGLASLANGVLKGGLTLVRNLLAHVWAMFSSYRNQSVDFQRK